MYLSSYPMLIRNCGKLYDINFIILVLSKFRVSLFAANHLPIRDTTLFDNIQKFGRDYDTHVISKYYRSC
jgi:hypothetical protein